MSKFPKDLAARVFLIASLPPPILMMKQPRAAGMLVSLVIKPIGGSFTPFAETIEIVVRNAV